MGDLMTARYNHKKNRRLVAQWLIGLGISLVMTLSGCALTPARPTDITRNDYGPAKQYLAAVIKREMAKYDVQGLSIALVDDQQVVWAEGFGYADVAHRVPATAETLYQVGSISKVVTATEIMRLVEQGRIDLDRPITDYLPEFSIRNRFADSLPITARALLAHHSGLPSDLLHGMWVDQPVSLAELVTSLREESLVSPPQTLYKYSNLDFSLLGRVIEKVEGQEFSAAMQQGLLNPLGMSSSSFQLTAENETQVARVYHNGQEAPRLGLRDAPAGSLLANVNDMSRWLRFIFADGRAQGNQVLKPETLQAMFQPQFPGLTTDFGHRIGLAWMLSGLSVPGAPPPAWHNGGYPPGYQAHLALLPEQKLGVIILSNSNEGSQFITQLGASALELAVATKFGAPPPAGSATEKAKPVRLSAADLARYAGNYAMFNGQLGSIKVAGDQLATSLFDRNFTLQPISADTFIPKAQVAFGLLSIPIDSLSVRFQTVQGKELAMLNGLPAPFAFARLEPRPIPEAWRKRMGRYRADTSGEVFNFKTAELTSESGVLVFKAVSAGKSGSDPESKVAYALEAITDDEAVVAGIGNGEGGVVRAIDRATGPELIYSGFHFVRIGEH